MNLQIWVILFTSHPRIRLTKWTMTSPICAFIWSCDYSRRTWLKQCTTYDTINVQNYRIIVLFLSVAVCAIRRLNICVKSIWLPPPPPATTREQPHDPCQGKRLAPVECIHIQSVDCASRILSGGWKEQFIAELHCTCFPQKNNSSKEWMTVAN